MWGPVGRMAVVRVAALVLRGGLNKHQSGIVGGHDVPQRKAGHSDAAASR